MAGIYLHIPFCKQACHYCNFHFSTSLQRKNDFITALLKEMEWRRDYLRNEPVGTIYLGGGTPSLLSGDELNLILGRMRSLYEVLPGAEVTLEANPDDMTDKGRMEEWVKAGVNRLSIGIQSFRESDLQWMNRAHTAGQALDAIKRAQDTGLENMSIDLIYGTPGLSDASWVENILQAVRLKIPHLSCYALTVEPKTALDKMIIQHKKEDVDPDTQARQFLLLMELLAQEGYEHYEISNFALPGLRSRHNSAYWQGKPYLGLGPSAHSFNGQDERQWNIANNARYITAMADESMNGLFEKEILTTVQQLNEHIMISLRTEEGIDLEIVERRFGKTAATRLEQAIGHFLAAGKILPDNRRYRLTREGRLLADGIAADLFFE